MSLGQSLEDYLKTIYRLHTQRNFVRSVDVANFMGYSKPSVSRAVKILREKQLVVMEEDGTLTLTKAGADMAKEIYDRHCFLAEYLSSVGVDSQQAEVDACRMEHIISEESFQKLKKEYRKKNASA